MSARSRKSTNTCDSGFLSHSVKLPRLVFNDPFLAAFHGQINHEGDIKNNTKPKTQPPLPPPKQIFN